MAGEPYVHQEFYDFSGGIQQAVGRILTSDNEFPLCINGELETVGPVSKIRGYQQRGSDVSTGYNILGAIAGYKSDGTMKQIAIADEGANSDAFTYNTINDTWTHHSLSLTSGAKAEIEYFLDGFFMVNFDDATRWNNYTQWYTTTNVTNAPKAKYIKLYGGRIYTAYVVDGGSTYPSRVIYSDLPAGTPYTIAWDNTTNYFDVDTDDKDVIKGLGLNSNTLLIFKENSLYRYNTNTLYKVPGAPGTVSQRSVKDLQGMTLYLHSTGIYMYDGSTSKLISRKIKDIIDGISTKNLTNACAYTKGDHYYVYVGDIDNTAKDIQIDKCLIDFDIAKNSLMLRSIEEEPTVFFTYRDDRSNITYNDATLTYNSADTTYNGLVSNQERIFFGTTDGEVHQQDTGNSFDGTDTKNGHTLTAIGVPVQGTPRWGTGCVGLGTSQAFSAVDGASFQPAGNFSVSAWIRTTKTGAQYIFQSYSRNTAYAGLALYMSTTATLVSGKNTGTTSGTDYHSVSGSTSIQDGAWHHIVGTYDGAKLHLYIDGAEEGTGTVWTNAAAFAATNYVRVGCGNLNGTNASFVQGALDEVSFYPSDALSLAEVQSLYAASITDGSNSAILAKAKAVYLFEDGAQLTDSTVNGHTLTAIGTPTTLTTKFNGSVFLGNSSAYSAVDHADFQPTGNFTVGGWIKTSDNTTTNKAIFNSMSYPNYAGISFRTNTIGGLSLYSGKNTGITVYVDYSLVQSTTTNYCDGNWHFVVATFDGSYLRLYKDGNLDCTPRAWAYAPAYAATNHVRVGAYSNAGTNSLYFMGQLDEVSFFPSDALSLAEVQSLYANSITHVTNTAILAKAKAVYLFEDGAQLTDSTVNGHTLTAIAFTLETKDYYLGYPAIYKLFQKIHIFVNGVRAISVQYKLDDGDWKTLGKVKKTQSELIFPAGSRGKRIKFRILESSSGDRYAFEGFDLYFSLENLSD